MKYPKFSNQLTLHGIKTLGTSVVYSPMSPHWKIPGKEGTLSCYYTSPQSLYNNLFLFVCLAILETFTLNFDWLAIYLSVQTFQLLLVEYYRKNIFCSILGYVHEFMGHCLIPLDPWVNSHWLYLSWFKINLEYKVNMNKFVHCQGSKGIRQWPINCCTFNDTQ